jgi:dephospho-CoA kinase
MDATVVVWAPREARLARVALRDGVARDAVERRMAAQIDADEARRRADYTIVNDDGIEALEARTRAVFERLTAKRAQA